ncbi:nucleoside-diphosphate sugar epimerase [Christiangramia fulva]|uniref:Nucleoside-diphosphate sugar epimerase n=1 Tax=Christiangramia fulva TaxID=2126553 RepID=A0A2R3Z386_9FLAO|nr:NAD(P)H-binding protein [Christiangramia fulva]AVR44698.1 nucleoside-diphosphate sugar epimerase [Christiangramia fulva]
MKSRTKSAIILGATGLTGGTLLQRLLKDDRYHKIKVFTRNHLNTKSEKLEEYLIDLFELEKFRDLFTADEVFCCVGSTQKKTPDKDTYRKVDYGIPATAATLCKQNKIPIFMVISAMGANENSSIFYNRTKGEMEGAVLDKKIDKTHILRPVLIGGEREDSRPMEKAFKKIMNLINPLLKGKFRKYQSIHPDEIVETMIYLANNSYKSVILESDEIKDVAQNAKR